MKAWASSQICSACRLSTITNPRAKYFWTAEQEELLRGVYREARNKRELSRGIGDMARRTGFPRYIVNLMAEKLRLTVDVRRRWTAEEMAILRELVGTRPVREIARRLHRSYYSVKSQIEAAGLADYYNGVHPTEGYSQAELAAVLGVPQQKVRRWIERGLLRIGVKGCSPDRIGEAEAAQFLAAHRDEYDLRRVDQAWFKGIVFDLLAAKNGVRAEKKPAVASTHPSNIGQGGAPAELVC
jgi:hypothetical protein